MKQQQASEQEKLQRLRENVEKQEARLKKVRALKGQVEQKRISNGKLGEHFSSALHVYYYGTFMTVERYRIVILCIVPALVPAYPEISVVFAYLFVCLFVGSGGDRADEQSLPAEAA